MWPAFPAGIIGILFNDVIDSVLSTPYVIAATLILYGVLFLILESRNKQPKVKKFSELTYQMALLIGVCQMLALIPGTSRPALLSSALCSLAAPVL